MIHVVSVSGSSIGCPSSDHQVPRVRAGIVSATRRSSE
jgi:hypothetical protein